VDSSTPLRDSKTLNFLFCSFLVITLSSQLVVTLVVTKSSRVVALMTTHDDESSHWSSPCSHESSQWSSPCLHESSPWWRRVVMSHHQVMIMVFIGLHFGRHSSLVTGLHKKNQLLDGKWKVYFTWFYRTTSTMAAHLFVRPPRQETYQQTILTPCTRILSVGIPHLRPFDRGIKSIFFVYLTFINY
jgi:hypothetical protein